MSPLEPDFDPKRRTVAKYGRYVVWLDPLVHLPWGLYRVYIGAKYVGAQISFPSKSDCEYLNRGEAFYAFATLPYTKQKARGVTAPAYQQWRKEKAAA